MDRNEKNIILAIEENILRFVPIDHEMCFVNVRQNYNLCSLYWLGLKDGGLNVTLSQNV
ncbi:hypothetical protein ARALYDRAFT_900904 [Arabidopsis lyrata subsp. lyrata]|uniref:Uncharacterized protein n=1 Tax=Arabidopsis lyrata subsp. lyrata TaxID=81972 RepID=D7LGR3_ARALL|nr:hypothetical protein ARALYDRAFT_900904 [Arabidopsis lyrata subsp. lyrata]